MKHPHLYGLIWKNRPLLQDFWSPFQRQSLLMGNHEDEKQEEGTKRKVQTAVLGSLQLGGKEIPAAYVDNLQTIHQTFCWP